MSVIVPPLGDRRLRVVDRQSGAVVDPLSGAPPLPAGSIYAIVVAGHLLGEALGQSDLPCAHYVDASPGGDTGPRVSLVLRVVPPPAANLSVRGRIAHELSGLGAVVLTASVVGAFRATHESVTTGLGGADSAVGGADDAVQHEEEAEVAEGVTSDVAGEATFCERNLQYYIRADPFFVFPIGPVDVKFITFTGSFVIPAVDRTISVGDLKIPRVHYGGRALGVSSAAAAAAHGWRDP